MGSSLTSRHVETRRQLRCVIAAGGTAGDVLSALAVAEVLTQRGVFVTLAGSPDRVEARPVPEGGPQPHPFRVQGFPRQPPPPPRGGPPPPARGPFGPRPILGGAAPPPRFRAVAS